MEGNEGNHHSQNSQGAVECNLYIAKADSTLSGNLADQCFGWKHNHIGDDFKADAKCHDDAANDQINKGRTPRAAKACRDKTHGYINTEAEEKGDRDLKSLLNREFFPEQCFQDQECHVKQECKGSHGNSCDQA